MCPSVSYSCPWGWVLIWKCHCFLINSQELIPNNTHPATYPHFSPCVKSFLGDSDSFSEHTPSQRWIHSVSDLGRRKNKTFSAQLLQLLSFLQCKLQSKQLPGISNGNVLLVCSCRQIITMTLLRTSICCLLPFRPSYAQVPSFFYASLSWICYL